MPMLSTFRREAFALSVARGATYTRAARNAGFRHPKVAERIAELRRTQARHPVTIFDAAGTPEGLYVPAA